MSQLADLIDQAIGIDSRIGKKTERWPYTDDFAIQRMKLGASLTVLRDVNYVLRYTIHHIGHPYKISSSLGEQLLTELTLRECWSKGSLGRIDMQGATLTLYQFAI